MAPPSYDAVPTTDPLTWMPTLDHSNKFLCRCFTATEVYPHPRHHTHTWAMMTSSQHSRRRTIMGFRDVHVIVAAIFCCTLSSYYERSGFSIAFTELAVAGSDESLGQAVKGKVMSAFYSGYAMMQLPGGWLSARYGGARILGLSFALWGTISMLMPGTVRDSSTAILTVCRVAIGASQGLLIPASHTILAKWVPVHERSRLVTLAMSGM